MKDLVDRATAGFRSCFGRLPAAVGIAPGRLEILGNHTDYNGGFILSVALDRATAVAIAPRDDERASVRSESNRETVGFAVNDTERVRGHQWADYVKGVVVELRRAGVEVPGFDAAVVSTVPIGAGLSSSAALEVATAKAVEGIKPYKMAPMELAKLCRRAENEFVGMGCGILDQFSAIYGAEGAFLFLDCLTLEPEVVQAHASDVALVVCDSTAKRELVEGKYDARRTECFAAARRLGEALSRKVEFLREVSLAEFEAHGGVLEPGEWKRANHVIRENARVLEGLEAARGADLGRLGRLMLESHASSRDHFENSCAELDALIEIAGEAPGFLGGKLSGGGFGGATVNLVERGRAAAFQKAVRKGFAARFGKVPETVVCGIGAGARWVKGDA